MSTVGVLALQGAFAKHLDSLQRLGVETREVRLPRELDALDGLIIPGGESTTIANLMDAYGLRAPIKACVREGMAVWGTCAGLILLARALVDREPEPLSLMDFTAARNSFGRQVDSFEINIPIPVLGKHPFHAVFIRAPTITRLGGRARGLASLPDGRVVAARHARLLATAFHPELTNDVRFHDYFLTMI